MVPPDYGSCVAFHQSEEGFDRVPFALVRRVVQDVTMSLYNLFNFLGLVCTSVIVEQNRLFVWILLLKFTEQRDDEGKEVLAVHSSLEYLEAFQSFQADGSNERNVYSL